MKRVLPPEFIKLFVYFLILIVLEGCTLVSFSPEVSRDEKPDVNFGYLLGRFVIENLNTNDLDIGLKISCGEKCPTQLIRFNAVDSIVAIAVRPGTYNIVSVNFIHQGPNIGLLNFKNEENLLTGKPFSLSFKVDAGKMYYLGDFVGETHINTVSYNTRNRLWKLTGYFYNPEQTKNKFISEHPHFSTMMMVEPFKPINSK